jgi:hypothetical protein
VSAAHPIEGNKGEAMVPRREGDFTTTANTEEMVMATSSKTSKVSRQARIQKVISGIQKYFLNQTALTLGGVSTPPTDLIKLLQSDIDASNAATATRALLTTDVQAERNSHQKVDPVLRFIKSFVMGQFGDTSDSAHKLEDFGYSPRKPRVTKVQVKAVAADKARATRVVRHTMGPKQKAKVKGTVAVAPSTDAATTKAPATPAATAAPAPAKPTA